MKKILVKGSFLIFVAVLSALAFVLTGMSAGSSSDALLTTESMSDHGYMLAEVTVFANDLSEGEEAEVAPVVQRDKKKALRKGESLRGKKEAFLPDLTDEQKEQIKAIKLEGVKKSKSYRDQLNELKAKHLTLSTADRVDMAEIYRSLEKMSALKLSIAKIESEKHQEVRSILTEEQRLVFDSKKRQYKGKGKGFYKEARHH